MSNNVLQKTKTAFGSFCILLPHNGLRVHQVLLPAVRQRFWLLSTGVVQEAKMKKGASLPFTVNSF